MRLASLSNRTGNITIDSISTMNDSTPIEHNPDMINVTRSNSFIPIIV